MDHVRAWESPQGTHVSQITLQFLVGEWLRMLFGLAENSGATLFVQSHDIKLMIGIPPGADPADPFGQDPSHACQAHPIAAHGREWQSHIIR